MELSAHAWSERMFGDGRLGDKRRTRRLVDVAGRMASHAGQSLASCCRSNAAALLGSYRFIENPQVDTERISGSAFGSVAAEASRCETLLAVEDTTTMLYKHSVAEGLGTAGSSPEPSQRGFLVHSVLLVDAQSESTVGLIDQRYWCRPKEEHGKKHHRKQRAYEDKESYKWQHASERVHARLGETMERTVSVCDRESDIYEFLRYKKEQGQRYVVRARCDRPLADGHQTLFGALADEQGYETIVSVAQRGGRPGRNARVYVAAKWLTVRAPRSSGKNVVPLELNAVAVREHGDSGHAPLNWTLLTSEPIDTEECVRNI